MDWKTRLYATDDVAAVKLGGRWRMPTKAEFEELEGTRENASYRWEWKSINGHNGWEVVYLVNGNSIFLPAAGLWNSEGLSGAGSYGRYWSSSLGTRSQVYAFFACLDWHGMDVVIIGLRSDGQSVRPVSE